MPEKGLGYAPESLIYHKEGGSSGATNLGGKKTTSDTDYFFLNSRLRFSQRYYPVLYPLIHLTLIGVMLNRIYRLNWGQLIGVFSIFISRGRKAR